MRGAPLLFEKYSSSKLIQPVNRSNPRADYSTVSMAGSLVTVPRELLT
jgi:hypothetical protein